MYVTNKTVSVITCTKCGYRDSAPAEEASRLFFERGWGRSSYLPDMHLCRNCQTPEQQKDYDFVKQKFNLDNEH